MFCEMTHPALQRGSSQPLSRLIAAENRRYNSMSPSDRLYTHRPFRLNPNDSRAGISAKIRRQAVPFLWVSLMRMADPLPDNDDFCKKLCSWMS